MIYCFDIDGVIATITDDNNYATASPISATIDVINELYNEGHMIKLYTARGSETGINWGSITKRQMTEWGVRHHELHMGKPHADFYIDDKMIAVEQLFGRRRTP